MTHDTGNNSEQTQTMPKYLTYITLSMLSYLRVLGILAHWIDKSYSRIGSTMCLTIGVEMLLLLIR